MCESTTPTEPKTGTSKTYSMITNSIAGNTLTGLDQLVDYIYADNGLAGANDAKDIAAGAAAANSMNQIIIAAAQAIGALADGTFSEADVIKMNQYIRDHYLTEWTALHGDDEDGLETGFHLIQNDGSNLKYRGDNLINTVADGIYHMGFEIVDGKFLNEDGDSNAKVTQVASWLNQFYTDHSTTDTGLDRIPNLIMADGGLAAKIPESDIEGGTDAADDMNHMILDAMKATDADADGWISTDDLTAMNGWIRSDGTRLQAWTDLHGDDERGSETGYHLVQNDGANTRYFGQNLVNTVADGIYHMGFEIQNGKFLNEDGNENARLTDVADWINYFYADQSTTGTGMDKIVEIIKIDTGLAKNTCAGDINQGAYYADQLNLFIIEAINETGAMADGWITSEDLVSMNDWIRSDDQRRADWIMLHGDDESDEETGYHLVQNDGANTQYFGKNLVNTVADGIYHMGFEIQNGRFLNEDGNPNAYLTDVAAWLNYFYKGAALVYGTDCSDAIQGSDDAEDIEGRSGNDFIYAGGGNDLINGGYGNDNIQGGAGDDILVGGLGNDTMDGGDGSDSYRITGNRAGGWCSFNGFDTYADTGANGNTGTDRIVAIGEDVDIGLKSFDASSGIEVIDATAATGTVRLLGDWTPDTLDFRGVTLTGNIAIDGAGGNDTLYGSEDANLFIGGQGNDIMDGGDGSDTYRITGNKAGGWCSFNGFDTYADTGATSDTDRIVAIGEDVDIGLKSFDASSGIEVIDATGATGTVRLLGDWTPDTLDFRGVTLTGNIAIDGAGGNDTLYGSEDANLFIGGQGNDIMDGDDGSDTYRITGNKAGGWCSFNGFDTYADSGAVGTDRIVAIGADVDIGLKSFGLSSGIEVIDATGATGTVRLLGDWIPDTLDFRGVTLTGNIAIDGAGGNDILYGNASNNTILGGSGTDYVYGQEGSDTLGGGCGNDFLIGGPGIDVMSGDSGKDRIVYASEAFGADDLESGGSDVVQGGKGDYIDFTAVVEGMAHLQGQVLSALTANVKVGSAIDAGNSFAFVNGIFEIDLNGDGAFQAVEDFQIDLAGVNTVTYNASGDYFMLS